MTKMQGQIIHVVLERNFDFGNSAPSSIQRLGPASDGFQPVASQSLKRLQQNLLGTRDSDLIAADGAEGFRAKSAREKHS